MRRPRHRLAKIENRNASAEAHSAALTAEKFREFEYPPLPSAMSGNGCAKANMAAGKARAIVARESQKHQTLTFESST